MRKFFSAVLFCAALVLFASCAKDRTISVPSLQEETAQVYDLNIRFDAPADQTEATVRFYDGNGQQVAVSTLSVPASSAETVSASFIAEARPEWLYTEGLQNGVDGGLLPITASSVSTRAGTGNEDPFTEANTRSDDGSILVVIRRP